MTKEQPMKLIASFLLRIFLPKIFVAEAYPIRNLLFQITSINFSKFHFWSTFIHSNKKKSLSAFLTNILVGKPSSSPGHVKHGS